MYILKVTCLRPEPVLWMDRAFECPLSFLKDCSETYTLRELDFGKNVHEVDSEIFVIVVKLDFFHSINHFTGIRTKHVLLLFYILTCTILTYLLQKF